MSETSPALTPAEELPANGYPLELRGVSRYFDRIAALRSVSVSFAPARLYAVVGDNGAGKSTLLRVCAGLLPTSRGSVAWFGQGELNQVRERITYMAHASLLYDELDAMENLRYFAGLYGMEDDRLCREAIAAVGLDPALAQRVGQYSQGMRQRLSLARALLHAPRLLLLDEPFSNVDASSARELVRLLGEKRDQGCTVLVVTHQSALLAGVADEFIHMADGRIIARKAALEELEPACLAAQGAAR